MFVLYVAEKAVMPNLAPEKGWHAHACVCVCVCLRECLLRRISVDGCG